MARLIAITPPPPPQHWSGPGPVRSSPNVVPEIQASPGPGPDHLGTIVIGKRVSPERQVHKSPVGITQGDSAGEKGGVAFVSICSVGSACGVT